ncbi:hypothetical protein Cfor_05568, partial [Coptotermes formosanus]
NRPEEWVSDVRVVAETTSDTSHQDLRLQCDKCRGVPERGPEAGAGGARPVCLRVSVCDCLTRELGSAVLFSCVGCRPITTHTL